MTARYLLWLFKPKVSNDELKHINELFKEERDKKGKSGWWFKYVIITIAVAISCFIAFDKFKIIDFENHKVKARAKKISNNYVSRTDHSGISNANYALERIVFEYDVDGKRYQNIIDVYYKDFYKYFTNRIDNLDSLDIEYDSRNPQISKFPLKQND